MASTEAMERENNNNNNTVRDINFRQNGYKSVSTLTKEELSILIAKPLDSEPDRCDRKPAPWRNQLGGS